MNVIMMEKQPNRKFVVSRKNKKCEYNLGSITLKFNNPTVNKNCYVDKDKGFGAGNCKL